MKVYVVVEEDRGWGPEVVGIYRTRDVAEMFSTSRTTIHETELGFVITEDDVEYKDD